VLVVSLFEEEEEVIYIASDVIRMEGENLATSGSLVRGDRARWRVGDPSGEHVLLGPPLRKLGTWARDLNFSPISVH